MEIKYQIYKEHQLLIHKYSGRFSLTDYTNCVLKMIKKPDWKFVTKVLNDLRDINLNHAITKMDELVSIRETIIKKELQTVILVDKPEATASAYLYAEKLKSKFNVWYCSSLEYTIEMLSLDLSETELGGMISNLQYKI